MGNVDTVESSTEDVQYCPVPVDHLTEESDDSDVMSSDVLMSLPISEQEITAAKNDKSAPEKDKLPDWVYEVAPQASTWSGLVLTFLGACGEIGMSLTQQKKALPILITIMLRCPGEAVEIAGKVILFMKESRNFAKLMSALNIISGVVAAVDIGLNVLSIIKEAGDLGPACSSYDSSVKGTTASMKKAWLKSKTTNKDDFIEQISDSISESRNDFLNDYKGEEATYRLLLTYRTMLKKTVDALGGVFKIITNIASAIVSIAADVASIISLFLGAPAGLVVGLVSGGITLLNWVIQEFDLDDKTVDTFTSWINNKYIPSLWGANISSETIYADLYWA